MESGPWKAPRNKLSMIPGLSYLGKRPPLPGSGLFVDTYLKCCPR